ncbi:MAG: RidA family protein [Candidatus Dormibacteraeota bacterium]|nr:RidA family protein [Candidatus Dormibacteraeota bacterium]
MSLPPVQVPLAAYVPARRAGDLLYLSGHVSRSDGAVVSGVVGDDVDPGFARELARAVALDLLATAAAAAGSVDAVVGVVRLTVFVRSAPGFGGQPLVANGASELLVELLGEPGRHARSAVGVSELPLGAAVEIDAVVEVR